jgi:hypothetical protein
MIPERFSSSRNCRPPGPRVISPPSPCEGLGDSVVETGYAQVCNLRFGQHLPSDIVNFNRCTCQGDLARMSRSRRKDCQRHGRAGRPGNLSDHLIQRKTGNFLAVDLQ